MASCHGDRNCPFPALPSGLCRIHLRYQQDPQAFAQHALAESGTEPEAAPDWDGPTCLVCDATLKTGNRSGLCIQHYAQFNGSRAYWRKKKWRKQRRQFTVAAWLVFRMHDHRRTEVQP